MSKTNATSMISIAHLNEELDRIGLIDYYDQYEIVSVDDAKGNSVLPYEIVRLKWNCGDNAYYRAGELAEALAEIEDDADPDTVLNDFPAEIDGSIVEAINHVLHAERELQSAKANFDCVCHRWHIRRPVDITTFRPVRYAHAFETDYCYGENGEVIECRSGKVKKGEQSFYGITPPELDRIEAEIAALLGK